MKLGLYGGGFKPFHTGHFAKLLLALDESDRVLSFFGIKKQKFSKKTGKPLKTHFRKFGNSGRDFDQGMQEKIVAIYEKALQDAYPGILDVVPSSDITPISNVHSMLDRFAYSQMTDDEKSSVSDENIPSLIYQSGDPTTGTINFNEVDEVTVVAGEDELHGHTYMGAINRRASRGDSPIGEKVKDLIDTGKIKLNSGMADEGRLVDLLRQYHPEASDEMVTVRGTGVRDFAGSRDVESLSRYLPNILPQDQKDEIIKILVGEPTNQQNESLFMPIITDSTVMRAAAKFTARKKISESSSKKRGEGHILGLTEDMSLTFDNLKSLIDDVLSGRVAHIEEKMDGQNFTFTVLDSGEIRLFGKGVSETTLRKGGAGREDVRKNERWNENVKDTFGSSMDVVDEYLDGKDAELIRRLFQDGKVVVEGQVMTPVNPNTIPYTENHVRFIKPFTPYDVDIDVDAYRDLFEDADTEIQDSKGREWSLGPVPKLAQVQTDAAEMTSKIHELQQDIDNLLQGMEPVPGTVGEYAARVLEAYLERVAPQLDLSGLSQDQKRRALQRLATGNKQIIGKPEMGRAWPEFQRFEKMRTAHVAAAIADLEKIIQKLGSYFFDTLEFALGTSESVVADLANEVEKIKRARDSDQIVVKNVDTGEISDMIDTAWATKLETSLARVEQMDLFKKAVEGVVLRLPDENGEQIVTKLTGMFTPVHRLVSLFRYPDRSSRSLLSIRIPDVPESSADTDLTDKELDAINEVLREFSYRLGWEGIVLEGGNSFKNTEGEHLTTEIEHANIAPTLSHFYTHHLSTLGFGDYNTEEAHKKHHLGSTGKKSKSGDIDIVIQRPEGVDNKLFKDDLLRRLNISLEDGDAKLEGSNIAVMYPIQGSQLGEYVQIDVMLSDCPADTCWQMAGTGDGEIKGAYRNILMGHIAKRISQDPESDMFPNEKIVIVSPGGLRRKRIKNGVTGHPHSNRNSRKWENIGPIISGPSDILSILGIDLSPDDAMTFVDVANAINDNDVLRSYLVSGEPGEDFERLSFEEYMGRHLSNKSTSLEARRAVDYINSMLDNRLDESKKDILKIELKKILGQILNEGEESKSTFPFTKTPWSEKIKIFSSGKWNLWNEKASATADSGKDPEGAEKAVAAMENLIYLGHEGYAIVGQGDGGVLIQGNGINAKLDADEAVEYITGIRTSVSNTNQKLPSVKIRHVAGTLPYDLELVDPKTALEVKKMSSKTSLKMSKLGSATGRLFDRHIKIIRPLRSAGQIAQKFIEKGDITDAETGKAFIREIENPPDGLDIEGVSKAVEMIDYLFNRIKYSSSPKELPGVTVKVEGGQIPAGMVKRIKRSDFLNLEGTGNVLEVCKSVLDNNLGDYSPAKEKSDTLPAQEDGVDITADTGGASYEGKVSLDYFYDDLIFRLFDHTKDGVEIDESLISSYTSCVEMIAELYSLLSRIDKNQGEDAFDEFITELGSKKYGGFYGVSSDHYYSVPCDKDHLDVYSTTQGFRAVLEIKSIPPLGPSIPDVKISEPAEEEEVDLEINLQSEEQAAEEVAPDISSEEEIQEPDEGEEIDSDER